MTIPSLYHPKLVAPRTWAIDEHGQDVFYVLYGSERALLVDTGFGYGDLAASATELIASVPPLPLAVVNTHGHIDHVTGNWQFRRVYIGAEDLPMISHPMPTERREQMLAQMRHSDDPALRELFAAGFPSASWGVAVPSEIVPIHEGFEFDLGDRKLEVISVPGHTPGSICLLDRAARLLLTGDDVHCGHIWMHLGHSTTLSAYLQSLYHLREWQDTFDHILWGHNVELAPASLLPALIAAVEGILAGKFVGEPHQTFAGDGLRYDFGAGSLIYRADRLE
jgi:hydroxyacylglutathione hydrolase